MQISLPTRRQTLTSLLRADFTALIKNRRSVLLGTLMPVLILVSWKNVVQEFGGEFALASCVTIGLMAFGLLSYPITIAKDREKGVFQRLRVTPAPTWTIMVSRLIVQVVATFFMTACVFVAGNFMDHITLGARDYAFAFATSLIGAAVFLSIGQALVGLVKSSDTVNALARLIYFPLIFLGSLAEVGLLGKGTERIVKWTPYGTVKEILFSSLDPNRWGTHTWFALLVSVGYIIFFSAVGIHYFRWNSE